MKVYHVYGMYTELDFLYFSKYFKSKKKAKKYRKRLSNRKCKPEMRGCIVKIKINMNS